MDEVADSLRPMDWVRWVLELLDGSHTAVAPQIIERTIVIREGGVSAIQWVTAGIAVVAAAFTGIGARTALRTWKRSEAERQREAANQRRAQASRVVATMTMDTVPTRWSAWRAQADVHNHSDLPIFKGAVEITDAIEDNTVVREFKTAPPGVSTFFGNGYTVGASAKREKALAVTLYFEDADNVSWVREADGTLHEFNDDYYGPVTEEQPEPNRTKKFWTKEFWDGRSVKAADPAG